MGMGLLPALEYAGMHLLNRDARVIPSKIQASPAATDLRLLDDQQHALMYGVHVQVRAMLAEMRITDVCGCDISYLNRYRWHPGQERLDLRRYTPHLHSTRLHLLRFSASPVWNSIAVLHIKRRVATCVLVQGTVQALV